MATLHNRVSRKELKQKALQDTTPRTTLSFYCYFHIEDPASFRDTWYREMSKFFVLGRIYIAHEGVNAQISCPDEHIEDLRAIIESAPALKNLRLNKAVDEHRNSFYVLDIKVRNKIVADGIEDPLFSMQNKGKYVTAVTFNEMVKDPNTMVIDMRNHYEYEVGRFRNAIEIPSDTFREQLPMAADMFKAEKDRNIIMYCTGGIRCEKASAWMLHNGYKNVFHLEGGIIHYINNVQMQLATSCSFNVMPAGISCLIVAARSVRNLFTWIWLSRKRGDRALTKAEIFSTNQKNAWRNFPKKRTPLYRFLMPFKILDAVSSSFNASGLNFSPISFSYSSMYLFDMI